MSEGKETESTPKPRRSWPRRMLDGVAVSLVLLALAWVAIFFVYAPSDLPSTEKIWHSNRAPGIEVVAADGSLVARRGGVADRPISVTQLPEHFVQAVIATEDRRFHDHFGVDPLGLVRATLANLRAGRVVQGGSTLTQQLAKNLFLSAERSLDRKLRELVLAIWLESKLTKNEILTLYLNRVYFGAGAHGVEAAAQTYFAKSARTLTLAESAMLAGLLKAPSSLAPDRNPKGAARRAKVVLANMVDAGYLSAAAAETAAHHPARVKRGRAKAGGGTGYFVDWVISSLPDDLDAGDRDLVVVTTLDPRLQASAMAATRTLLAKEGKRARVSQAALVLLDQDGAVRALVGGANYARSQYNRATQARRPPASAFKPVVYLTALEAGLSPDSQIKDTPITIEGWSPRNYDGRFHGPMAMRDALAKSVNPAAIRLQEQVGRDKVIAMAERLGLGRGFKPRPSLALGTHEVRLLDLTAAHAAIANGGILIRPHAIFEVRTRDGVVLHAPRPPSHQRAVSSGVARQMTRMLEHAVRTGTGRAAQIPGLAVAGKSGTSSNNRDAWFIGSVAGLSAGVWMGNDDNAPMRGIFGGGPPARLWKKVMSEAASGPALASVVPTPRPRPQDGITGILDRVLSMVLASDPAEQVSDALPKIEKPVREAGGGLLRWLADRIESGGEARMPPDEPPQDLGN